MVVDFGSGLTENSLPKENRIHTYNVLTSTVYIFNIRTQENQLVFGCVNLNQIPSKPKLWLCLDWFGFRSNAQGMVSVLYVQ
jgi:hypothetical protein